MDDRRPAAPSVWPESFGVVTREALAWDCWVVASDRGGVGEPVVEGVNGHIVDVADIDGLTSTLRQIHGNPETPEYSTSLRRWAGLADDVAALHLKVAGKRAETVIHPEVDGVRARGAQSW
jgi:glycosyltransferase involved in cell wall biosynthesis